jgi:hypothetical protein
MEHHPRPDLCLCPHDVNPGRGAFWRSRHLGFATKIRGKRVNSPRKSGYGRMIFLDKKLLEKSATKTL